MASKKTIAEACTLIQENWPNQEWDPKAMLRTWQQILGDLTDEVVQAAVLQRIASGNPFPPRVGEIRQAAIALMTGADEAMPALQAWGEVLRYLRRYGSEGIPRWTEDGPQPPPPLPPLVGRAVEAVGGLRAIGMSENAAADRARFVEAYDIFLQRAKDRVGMLPAVREARKLLQAERKPLLGDGHDQG